MWQVGTDFKGRTAAAASRKEGSVYACPSLAVLRNEGKDSLNRCSSFQGWKSSEPTRFTKYFQLGSWTNNHPIKNGLNMQYKLDHRQIFRMLQNFYSDLFTMQENQKSVLFFFPQQNWHGSWLCPLCSYHQSNSGTGVETLSFDFFQSQSSRGVGDWFYHFSSHNRAGAMT